MLMPDATDKMLHEQINPALRSQITRSITSLFPIHSADGRTTVEAESVTVSDGKFDPADLNAQQKAREQGETRGAKIMGKMKLIRDGKVVQNRTVQLGTLPLMNALGTFNVGGNDWYAPKAQLRLKNGVYTREKDNGLYESFIRIKGRPMSVWMDPAKGVLKIGYGSVNVNWYPVVRALGATEADMIRALGNSKAARELIERNRMGKADVDLTRLYAAIFEFKQNRDLIKGNVVKSESIAASLSQAEKVAALKAWFETTSLDPRVTKQTLGLEFAKVSTKMLLAVARKILAVQRHDEEPDDRDAPQFKEAHGIEDLMAERVQKLGTMLVKDATKKMKKPDATLGQIFGSNWTDPATVGYFGGARGIPGGLAGTAEAANPLAIMSEQSKMTLRGEGGIQSDHAITLGARLFRPEGAGFVDPVKTVEGSQIGVTTHSAGGVVREGRTLKAPFYPVKSGKVDSQSPVYLSVEDASEAVIGYPEYWDPKTGKPTEKMVRANKRGNVEDVPASTVQYVLPSGMMMFSTVTNAASFLSNTHPNRGMMAGKHLTQALPLKYRETPLVKQTDLQGRDVLESLAKAFTIRATVSGRVEAVTNKYITIAGVKHTIYNRYPMQAKVSLDHNPVVKVGDVVRKGQLIADSNYSREGRMALGVNLRSAYTPWKGAGNFEDAIVISESAAQKLTSEHLHREKLLLDKDIKVNPKLFVAQFPTALSSDNLGKLDSDGYVKKGQKVSPGDVLIAAVRKRNFEEKDRSGENLARIHKSLMRPYIDASLKWDEEFQGEVIRVIKTPEKVEIHIRTEEEMRVGDKLSMGSAAKGTVSMIVPDDEMPRNKKGQHMEVILNPHGVAGRMNPSQTIEQAAGKLVRDGKEEYAQANFDDRDHAQEVRDKLKSKGMSHAELLYDPQEGKWTERPVATGYNYMVKLDHPVRKKFSARTRDGYTMDESPTTGKGKGAQSYDQLTTYALLGHNAHAILGESMGIRGTKNEDFWRAYQAGEMPTPPKTPFAFEKFRAYLNASGVDTKQHGNVLHYLPMTDKRISEMSNGAITSARQIRAKDLAEEAGGLFDVKTTGGLYGKEWSHIDLKRKMPHPLHEKAIRDILEIKQSEFYGLVAGTMFYDPKATTNRFSTVRKPGSLTGAEAFQSLLSFDVKARLAEVKRRLKTATGSDRNRLHRASRYLRGLQQTGLSPAEAYLSSKIPVVPPAYRGIVEMNKGGLRVDPSNLLYRDLIMNRDLIEKAEKEGTLPEEELAKARLALYDSHAAVIGVGKSLTHRRDADDTPGFIQVIKGKSNKTGLFQRQLARRRNDYSGRSTIEPDANLGVDEIGIPEEMAWKIYEPTVIRRLSKSGWKPADAVKQVKDRTLSARNALSAEMEDRPVLYNRAPSLHRWSMASAIPHLTPGKEIKISPSVVGPFGADFDGDTMSVTVPITEAAKQESKGLLPSKNLYYDKDRELAYGPEKDVIAGVFALTRKGRPTGVKFNSAKEAIDAYRNNTGARLRMDSQVKVKGVNGMPTIGQLIFLEQIPDRFRAGLIFPIDKKKMETLLDRVAKEAPADFNRITRHLTQVGFKAVAAAGGVTATVDELVMDRAKSNRLLDSFERDIRKGKTPNERRDLATRLYDKKYKKELQKEVLDQLAKHEVGYADIIESGSSSKANPDQFQQILISPTLVKDVNDRVVPSVIKSSYGRGMRPSDYVLATPGARAGLVARSLSTAMPGALAKEVAANMGSIRVTEKDCGTNQGISLPLKPDKGVRNHDADLLDRYLLRNQGSFKRNDLVTPEVLAKLRDQKLQQVWVRSPMTCKSHGGPCQMCAGASPDGKAHDIGANIGINYGQALSERSTQLTMRMFHSGGSVGSGDSLMSGFKRLRELLTAPSIVRDQGTLADVDGRVVSIKPAPQGGKYIMIQPRSGQPVEHYAATGRREKVKVGDTVKSGDELTDGNFRPQEIAAKKGTLAAQQYVVNSARKAYQDAGAVVRKPVLEVIAAGTMRYVEITDDGGEDDLAPGDILHENEFAERKKKNPRILSRPAVMGISKKPLTTSNDLLERLNFQRLEDAVREAPSVAGQSDLTGKKSPIPGFAYGAKFRHDEESSPFK